MMGAAANRAAELGDFFELGALGFEFFGNGSDKVIDGAVEGLGVKDDQALVFATHLVVGVDCYECGSDAPQFCFAQGSVPITVQSR